MKSLTEETLYELQAVARYLDTSKDLWVVVLQGQGDHFSSGVDLELIQSRLDKPDKANRKLLSDLQACFDEFEALEKPTIAKLDGFCMGGGLVLALCCDFRIASRRTVFSLPEVQLGLPILMGTQRLTRVVGMGATKEMILLSERLNARKAQEYGMLHQGVPLDELDDVVRKFAEKFLTLPPRTVGLAKRTINVGCDMTLQESQELEIDTLTELLKSPDVMEAFESYTEKRPPKFSGE
ncbi:MAG: enoyl-CoA hydratase/isomerase family protein [Anaerolineales bacterium]|nr:MAG: enoyl-CoA hydratase/isomerase family protein [Anaerolineales bacterium]